ncbi:MAG: hypothetical protein ACRD0Y_07305 [Terriglobales bacterium]
MRRARRLQHGFGFVQAGDGGAGPCRGQHRGAVARSAAGVDHLVHVLRCEVLLQARHQIAHHARALFTEAKVLLRIALQVPEFLPDR